MKEWEMRFRQDALIAVWIEERHYFLGIAGLLQDGTKIQLGKWHQTVTADGEEWVQGLKDIKENLAKELEYYAKQSGLEGRGRRYSRAV